METEKEDTITELLKENNRLLTEISKKLTMTNILAWISFIGIIIYTIGLIFKALNFHTL